MSSEQLNEVIKIAKAGDISKAKKIVFSIIKSDPKNEKAWLFFAKLTKDKSLKIKIYNKCLKYNPDSKTAKEYLNKHDLQRPKNKISISKLSIGFVGFFVICLFCGPLFFYYFNSFAPTINNVIPTEKIIESTSTSLLPIVSLPTSTHTPLPTITWTLTASPTQSPIPQPTATTKPSNTQPPASPTITLKNLSSPIERGDDASMTIETKPGISCSISYYAPLGNESTAKGLESKTSDSNGICSWTWRISGNTTPGTGTIYITVSGTNSQSFSIVVLD